MFDNLVESNSHKDDISRKGSFILVTVAVYAVLGTGISSLPVSTGMTRIWRIRIST